MRATKTLLSSIAVIAIASLVLLLSFQLDRITSNSTSPSGVEKNNNINPERDSSPISSISDQDLKVPQASIDQPQVSSQRQIQNDLRAGETITEDSEPVVMSDYQNWTVIANNIESTDGVSIATGDVGVAHRDGMFAVADKGIITHTNQDESVDSVYLPGESTIELPGGITIAATEAELIQKPDGSHTMHVNKAKLIDSSNAPTTIFVNGEEISP